MGSAAANAPVPDNCCLFGLRMLGRACVWVRIKQALDQVHSFLIKWLGCHHRELRNVLRLSEDLICLLQLQLGMPRFLFCMVIASHDAHSSRLEGLSMCFCFILVIICWPWQFLIELAQLWCELDCIEKVLSIILELADLIRIVNKVAQLILKAALRSDQAILVDVFVDELLIQQGVARWSKPWVGL